MGFFDRAIEEAKKIGKDTVRAGASAAGDALRASAGDSLGGVSTPPPYSDPISSGSYVPNNKPSYNVAGVPMPANLPLYKMPSFYLGLIGAVVGLFSIFITIFKITKKKR